MRIFDRGEVRNHEPTMNKKIHPVALSRLESLRAPWKARLQEIKKLLEEDPRDFQLIIELESIRQALFEIQRDWEGGAA